MKRKIVGILVVTLLIATAVLPVVAIMNVDKTKLMENSISGGNEVKQDVVPENRERKILNRPFRSLLLPSWLLEIFNGDWDYWTNPPNMYAIPTGNVGIGTSNPTSELEVAGRIEADGFTINGIPVGTSTDSYWSAYEADLFYYGTITIGALDIEALNLRGVGDPPETPPGLLVKGDIIAEKGEHGTGNITARGHLNTDGNVTAKGHMKSEGNVTAKGHMKSEGNVTAKGHMKSEGNVTAKGHMKSEGDVTAKGHMKSEGNVTADGNITAGKDLIVGRWLKFLSVGMGIIFPDGSIQKKAATGAGGDDGDWIKTANGDMYANVPGNVGIGTTSPDAKLDVESVKGDGAAEIGDSSNSATGDFAVAMGSYSVAIGDYSTAMGNHARASGHFSTAMGSNTQASGLISTAMGDDTNARGDYGATAMGYKTNADGNYGAIAMGSHTTARGHYSTAMGRTITVSGGNSVGIGLNSTSYTVTNPNVMSIMGGNVGIGTTSPSEELHVVGDIYCTGKLTSDGGNDPPYVLYNSETRESIKERVAKEVPSDKQGGAVLFWNGETLQFEIYLPAKGEFRDILGNLLTENPENSLYQRIVNLEARITELESLLN